MYLLDTAVVIVGGIVATFAVISVFAVWHDNWVEKRQMKAWKKQQRFMGGGE